MVEPFGDKAIVEALKARYANAEVEPEYLRLYPAGEALQRMCAGFHQRLNALFTFMNYKAGSNRHYNADESRELLALIDEIDEATEALGRVGIEFEIADPYASVIDRCRGFLRETNGSAIPEDFPRIKLAKYEAIFAFPSTRIRLRHRDRDLKLRMIGQGAHAIVYRFTDPDYGIPFALKRAKPGLTATELARFRQEFDLLHDLKHPYLLEAYRYNEDKPEYTMEFCDSHLGDFIARRNAVMSFDTRKRIALQFLYGLNYLHKKGHLHRDISLRNTLVKEYDESAVLIKLSDFGLAKTSDSELTRTESELRGTILDPMLPSFKDYGVLNEMYSIGVILSYVFSGRKGLDACTGDIRDIIDKCVSLTLSDRYPTVYALITDLESLEPTGGAHDNATA